MIPSSKNLYVCVGQKSQCISYKRSGRVKICSERGSNFKSDTSICHSQSLCESFHFYSSLFLPPLSFSPFCLSVPHLMSLSFHFLLLNLQLSLNRGVEWMRSHLRPSLTEHIIHHTPTHTPTHSSTCMRTHTQTVI